jgi:hypothetical protein
LAQSVIAEGTMSGGKIMNIGNSDNGQHWAALDSRFERLANATDRVQADGDDCDHDRDRSLKAAS